MRELLLGYLIGALDEPDQELVEARLQFDPQWRMELGRLRERLSRLDAAAAQYEPPAGLAERTCAAIFGPRPLAGKARQRHSSREGMSPALGPAAGGARLRPFDVTAVACIAVATILLVLPAIQASRFNSQVVQCQNNLRELGGALAQYSEQHNGHFPRVPVGSPLGVAGIYAPTLVRNGLLHETCKVICPASSMSGQEIALLDLDRLEQMSRDELKQVLPTVGGSYGYSLGHIDNGRYHDIVDQRRPYFALMSDAPVVDRNGRTLNHGGRGENVLFEDGAVRFVTTSKPMGVDDIFSNDAGDVAAGLHANDSVIVPSGTAPKLPRR